MASRQPQRRRPVRSVPDEQPQRRSTSNGFYDAPVRLLLGGKPVHFAVCSRCGCYVPGGQDASKAQALHRSFHEQLDGIDQR
jgi:hypothetical protein